jgi:hypothetical protein
MKKGGEVKRFLKTIIGNIFTLNKQDIFVLIMLLVIWILGDFLYLHKGLIEDRITVFLLLMLLYVAYLIGYYGIRSALRGEVGQFR